MKLGDTGLKLWLVILLSVALVVVAFVVGGLGAAVGLTGTILLFIWLGRKDQADRDRRNRDRIEYKENNWGL